MSVQSQLAFEKYAVQNDCTGQSGESPWGKPMELDSPVNTSQNEMYIIKGMRTRFFIMGNMMVVKRTLQAISVLTIDREMKTTS